MRRVVIGMAVLLALVISSACVLGATRSRWDTNTLVFYDDANQETVRSMNQVWFEDEFLGTALDATNDWTVAGVNSGTCAINAAIGGTARITTGAADDDDVDVATLLVWESSKRCCMEARIASGDADGVGWNVGFSDATGEAADLIAVTYTTSVLTTTASDFAGFFQDPDNGANVYGLSVAANTDGTVIDTGTDQADGVYHIYRVEIDASGNVDYWVDGAHVGSQTTGITTTTDLCVYVAAINREAAANTVDIDYVRAWQTR